MTRIAKDGIGVADFEGKHCVLTGGAGSIGLATAHQLLARGATVRLVDRDGALLDTARRTLTTEGHGARVGIVGTDVTDSRQTAPGARDPGDQAVGMQASSCAIGSNPPGKSVRRHPSSWWSGAARPSPPRAHSRASASFPPWLLLLHDLSTLIRLG